MKRWLLAVGCVAIAGILRGADAPPAAPRLTIAGTSPRPYSCGQQVEPVAERRPYTIAADADPIYTLGILEAGETTIPCGASGGIELRVSTRRLPRRGDVVVTIAGTASVFWQLSIAERQIGKAITVQLPRGTYEMAFMGARSLRLRKHVVVADSVTSVAADLEPSPKLSGVVIGRATGRAVAGALVLTDVAGEDVDQSAITDATGHFSIDADPERWPSKIVVRAIPFAEATAPVPAAHASAVLPDIYVSRGGSISVEVQQQHTRQVVDVELLRIVAGSATGKTVSVLPADPALQTAPIRFDNVEPGRYVVLARGDDALERYGTEVEVVQGHDVGASIAVTPFRLRLRTKMEGEPLADADILLTNLQRYWEGSIHTDDEGRAEVNLWQGGKMRSAVHADGFSAPSLEHRTLEGKDDAEWVMDIPAREITGMVIDSKTGRAIPGAALALHIDAAGGYSLGVKTKADAEGRFRFFPVSDGRHTLTAGASQYPPSEMTYLFPDSEHDRNITVRLDRAATVALTVLNHAGAPMALARAIQFKGGIRMEGRTDSSGRVDVPVPEDGAVDVYIVPREGSFGIATLRADGKEAVIRIAEGVARIDLRAETNGHEPIPNVSLLARYNGRVLPVEVFDALAGTRGGRMGGAREGRLILAHMPAGLFEFWPVGSDAELQALQDGRGSPPSVRMSVVPGENVAVMTFEPVTTP
jgi:hypothetical protein